MTADRTLRATDAGGSVPPIGIGLPPKTTLVLAYKPGNQEISSRLCLSVRTVESQRARIQHKTGATRAAYARERGLGGED